MSEREDGIRAALANLGPTADDMAASLRAAGITGIRDDGEHCPLANYLRLKGFDGINVTRDHIEEAAIRDSDGVWIPGRWNMPTPPVAQLFIERFDDPYGDLADEA